MNSDLTASKLAIALIGAVAGWLLAQITTSIRALVERRRAKKLLLEELKDIKIETVRLLNFYSRQLQIHGARGIGASSSVGIDHPIYENYYKVALLSLKQSQRISFQMIHRILVHVNVQLQDFKNLTESLQKEHAEKDESDFVARNGKRWGDAAKAAYTTVGSLQWHVIHHLKNPSEPTLQAGDESHRAYLQSMEALKLKADEIINSGELIDRERFNKVYDPENFPPQP